MGAEHHVVEVDQSDQQDPMAVLLDLVVEGVLHKASVVDTVRYYFAIL